MSLPDPFDSEPVPQERLSRRTIISWLVVVGLAILFLPIYLIYTGIRGEAARLQAELEPIQLMLTNVGTPVPEVLELVSTLTHVHESVSQVQAVYPTLAAAHADWPAIAAAIAGYDSSQLAVIGLSHVERQITLTGRAADDDAVIAYARSLEASGLFARVVVQSIKTVATPYATPTSTAVFQVTVLPTPTIVSPPTATYTATPDSRDGYEPDDITPADIFIGQAQQHNFEPVYDVDRVQFLVKAGRYYKVSTLGLAPGVDTLLVVGLGGAVYTNDDRQPGDLSSEVSLRGGSTDLGAVVEIRNRGHYGADKSYQVMVQEVIPTSTPAPTSTSIPTWTPIPTATPTQPPTSTPTLTVTPSPTPTATPDLRDAYEPDEGQPKPIAVGETQIRSFYPQDDLDIGTFLVKAGRFYRVYTWNLAVGVDTRLTVLVGQTEYVNDDRAPGDLSSEISFEVPATNDIVALFFAANRGQYGPDKHYQITVEEYVPTVTPTPEVTATVTPTETVQPASYVRPFGRGLVPLALVSNQEAGSVEFVIVLDLWDAAP